jgi:hypothetical protein
MKTKINTIKNKIDKVLDKQHVAVKAVAAPFVAIGASATLAG